MTILGLFIAMIAFAASPALLSPELPIKPPKHGGVYVVAHRGAHLNIPENTLAAYQKAIDLGVDFVEIDVRTTKDGKFVSCHNKDVDAYTNGGPKGLVKDYTLAELRAMDIGSRVGPQHKGAQIPTFEEVLDLCKGRVGIYLDLKEAPIPELVRIVKERGMEHDIIWYISSHKVKELREVCPECIEMPDPGPEQFLAKLIADTKPRVIASSWRFYSKTFADACHAAKAIVIVDCMDNDPKKWQQAVEWNTDGLQTDYPEELIAWLKTNGRKPANP